MWSTCRNALAVLALVAVASSCGGQKDPDLLILVSRDHTMGTVSLAICDATMPTTCEFAPLFTDGGAPNYSLAVYYDAPVPSMRLDFQMQNGSPWCRRLIIDTTMVDASEILVTIPEQVGDPLQISQECPPAACVETECTL